MTQEEIIKKNKDLCKKYPFLLPRNDFTDKVPDDYDYSYTEIDAIPEGWQIAFGDMLIKELGDSLRRTGNHKSFRFDQIKEKWGSLRIYHHGGNDKSERIIEKYSTLSENICMLCGKPDVYMTNRGWLYPCCKECWENNERHTNIPYEDNIEGEAQMVDKMRWRSYIPGDDDFVDNEIDISETAEEIRKRWKKRCENSK